MKLLMGTWLLFVVLILVLLGSLFEVYGAEKDVGTHVEAAKKRQLVVTTQKVSVETDKKDAKGKAIIREFPTMFDILHRAEKVRAKKSKQKATTK